MFNPAANPNTYALTDYLAFNWTFEQQQRQNQGAPADQLTSFFPPSRGNYNDVADLQLRVSYERLSGSGPMDLALTKLGHKFTARFLPDQVQLLHQLPDGTESTVATHGLSGGASPMDVQFENVDYRVAIRVNGTELIATKPAQYAPDINALVEDYQVRNGPPSAAKALTVKRTPDIAITSSGQASRLSHLSLWRDVYYTNNVNNPAYQSPPWASPANPIVLGPGEYFPMGDNSPLSLDARYWKYPIDLPAEDLLVNGGRVPERFMLGKAFFVYWPAGFRFSAEGSYGIIPNFGEMRLIH